MTIAPFFRLTAVPRRVAAQRAYTLTELLAVVVLLGLAATIAMPSPTPGESRKLDLTAVEIANAMRFARSEAMRTGDTMGFHLQWGAKRIRVFSIDTDSLPATIEYDVYHPVDRNIYIRQFSQQPFAFDGNIQNSPSYRGTCNTTSTVYFDAGGTPWCSNPDDVLLERFDVKLTLGNSSRVVTLNGITGRVTIQ
jgi:prepilin-type N-terminal cleavage/methylation domain-containing protein